MNYGVYSQKAEKTALQDFTLTSLATQARASHWTRDATQLSDSQSSRATEPTLFIKKEDDFV